MVLQGALVVACGRMKAVLKLVGLGLLAAGYWLLGGFAQIGNGWPLAWALLFFTGALVALWAGRKPVGELRPVSFRALYVLGGLLLMIWAVFMMLTTREMLGKKVRGKVPATKPANP